MKNLTPFFCYISGAEKFADLLNFTYDAIIGNTGPGLKHLDDPEWDQLVQGGKWKGCWSQNYYGMIGCTPILFDRLLTAHSHSLERFFEYQGDGKLTDRAGFTAPVGALPEYIAFTGGINPHYKNDESSGLADEFDFWVEGTAVSVLQTGDLLLSTRDKKKIHELLPKIELALAWLLSRQDKVTGLLKVNAAGTLIERAYGATFRSKGVTDYGLPSGTAVNTIKAFKTTAELEDFIGNSARADEYRQTAAKLQQAINQLLEKNLYLINYIDADGIRHGVPGADKHGYFECNANLDAAAWDILPPEIANNMLDTIKSFAPTPLAPSVWKTHDDSHWSYQQDDPAYGGAGNHWNGAAWFSSQSRYLLALLKNNRFEEAFAVGDTMRSIHNSGSMRDVMFDYGTAFSIPGNPDAPNAYYIDGYGAFGGLLRGLFEVEYFASSVKLIPHIPPEAEHFQQFAPYRWGSKKLYCHIKNAGSKTVKVTVNGQPYDITGNGAVIKYSDLSGENAEIIFERA